MHVTFEWRATVAPPNRPGIERAVKYSLGEFFKCPELPVRRVSVTALEIGPGGKHQQLLKVLPTHRSYGRVPGLPVNITTGGSQGLVSIIEVDGLGLDALRSLVEAGPYRRRSRRAEASVQDLPETVAPSPVEERIDEDALRTVNLFVETVTSVPIAPIVEVQGSEEIVSAGTVQEGPRTEQTRRISPRERLEANGVCEQEITRLKATLATIVKREMEENGGGEIPTMLQVPVKRITKAIMEHMGLSSNAAGNYRGIIASFYSARIALFALKWENKLDPNDLYEDWMFDCVLVLDFIGGKDQLEHLTRERDAEVKEREEALSDPAPDVAEVTDIVLEGFLPDGSVLELVARTLAGKKEAERSLELAKSNRDAQKAIVEDLDAKLLTARAQLTDAEALVKLAEEKVRASVIPPDVLEKVRQAKLRLDALASDLGL